MRPTARCPRPHPLAHDPELPAVAVAALRASGVARALSRADQLARTDVSIRGRHQPLGVCTVADATSLASLLDAQATEAEGTTSAVAYDLA